MVYPRHLRRDLRSAEGPKGQRQYSRCSDRPSRIALDSWPRVTRIQSQFLWHQGDFEFRWSITEVSSQVEEILARVQSGEM